MVLVGERGERFVKHGTRIHELLLYISVWLYNWNRRTTFTFIIYMRISCYLCWTPKKKMKEIEPWQFEFVQTNNFWILPMHVVRYDGSKTLTVMIFPRNERELSNNFASGRRIFPRNIPLQKSHFFKASKDFQFVSYAGSYYRKIP